MNQMAVLVHQMLLFSTFIAIGFIFNRLRLFTEDLVMALSRIVVRVLLPMVIITVLPSGGSRAQIFGMIPFLGGICIMYLVLFGLGILSAKLLKLEQPTKNIHIAITGFTNSGFLGLPLMLAVYPDHAALAYVPYAMMEVILLYGKLKFLMEPEQEKAPFQWKAFLTPTNISLVIGLLLLLLNIQPSGPIWEGMTAIGGTCKYMALLYIGGIIGVKGFGPLLKRWQVFLLVPIKLLLAPVIVYLLVGALHILDDTYLMILTTYAMLPCMVVVSILADANGSDGEYATAAVLITTICSMATIPFVTWFVTTIL